MFDVKPYSAKMEQALARFQDELKKIRTGRAHPDMLDSVMVEAYGTKMPLNQTANVTAPEPQLLQITPFDPSQMVAIQAAIREDQTLGLNPSDDGRVIRVPIPTLTEERRKHIAKQAGEKLEEARIQLRSTRQDAFKDLKRRKDAKELSEDDVKRYEKDIDRIMGDFQEKLEQQFKAKEKEILTV